MSVIRGKVGTREISWPVAPRGVEGSGRVSVCGELLDLRWWRDADGLWIEFPHGVFGFDFEGEPVDDGRIGYRVSGRQCSREWEGLGYLRAGEENTTASSAGAHKKTRVRAQMPGKILRVLAKTGESVGKGQPILVMEAMKMENEIKAPVEGVVSECRVSEGQAVETGVDLMILEPGEPCGGGTA